MHDQPPTRAANKNLILAALPDEEYHRLLPHLKKIKLPSGEILYHPDENIDYLYFPDNAMISIIATTPDGQSAEVGVVGKEGIAGVDILMGVNSTPNQSLVQLPDEGWKLPGKIALEEFRRGGEFQRISLLYIHAFMLQISQTALCNRLHTVEQRLARWLLLSHDRAEGNKLALTQEFLSIMLGTTRPSVTTAALILQGGDLIRYRRGNITVTDREGLEHFACDCYAVVKEKYDDLPI